MKKLIVLLFGIPLLSLCLTGCESGAGNDDLHTVPVTNNPNLIPSQAQTPMDPPAGGQF